MKEQRTPFFDIVKGISIFLVILGHCIQYGSGTQVLTRELFFNNIWFRAVYSFHMPLFMLISGYLFGNSCRKHSWRSNLLAKVNGLEVPIVAWGTINFFIDVVTGKNGGKCTGN